MKNAFEMQVVSTKWYNFLHITVWRTGEEGLGVGGHLSHEGSWYQLVLASVSELHGCEVRVHSAAGSPGRSKGDPLYSKTPAF